MSKLDGERFDPHTAHFMPVRPVAYDRLKKMAGEIKEEPYVMLEVLIDDYYFTYMEPDGYVVPGKGRKYYKPKLISLDKERDLLLERIKKLSTVQE